MKKQIKHKIYALILGVILALLVVLLYFLDTSLRWNFFKIFSCVIVSIWVFFIPPTILYYHYNAKNSSMKYNISLGISIGMGDFIFAFLLAPIIGIMTYFVNLDEIKH